MQIRPPSPRPQRVLIPKSLWSSSRRAGPSPGAQSPEPSHPRGSPGTCCCSGSAPWPGGRAGAPLPNPTRVKGTALFPLPSAPASTAPFPGLGWFGGPKPTPLQATGQAGLPAAHPEGTVPGRQLGRLEGQRSAVSCPGEIKENRGGLRTSGPAGCQDALGRRLEGAALPFRPIALQPALPIPVDGLHCVLPHHGQGWTPSTPRASPGPDTLKTGPRKGGSLQSRARAGA